MSLIKVAESSAIARAKIGNRIFREHGSAAMKAYDKLHNEVSYIKYLKKNNANHNLRMMRELSQKLKTLLKK